jgi:hypothetical protein
MTPQRPAKRAKEQDAAAVQHWLDHEYPRLVRRAKREKAEIQWVSTPDRFSCGGRSNIPSRVNA